MAPAHGIHAGRPFNIRWYQIVEMSPQRRWNRHGGDWACHHLLGGGRLNRCIGVDQLAECFDRGARHCLAGDRAQRRLYTIRSGKMVSSMGASPAMNVNARTCVHRQNSRVGGSRRVRKEFRDRPGKPHLFRCVYVSCSSTTLCSSTVPCRTEPTSRGSNASRKRIADSAAWRNSAE